MDPTAVIKQIQAWMKQERLTVKTQQDPRAEAHFLIKYPAGNQGHMFAVVVPKGRDLVAISSMTRVDEGQQNEMAKHMEEDREEWLEWIHEARLQLIHSTVDWGIHMGHTGKEKSGPLQAFNVSLPIWFDGLTKNEFMHGLRKLWLAKLGIIHEIKYNYGSGIGKPGPVDDWPKPKSNAGSKNTPTGPAGDSAAEHEIEFDEKMTFGSGFDPSEWA